MVVDSRDERIALLEDRPALAIVASRPPHLEALTYHARSAGIAQCAGVNNESELLRCIEHTLPDVLLLDIDLDGRRRGLDLLETALVPFSIPTILVADDVDAGILARSRNVGAVGFLVLPCSPVQVDATLSVALGLRQANSVLLKQLSDTITVLHNISSELEQVRDLLGPRATAPRLRAVPGLTELSVREREVLLGLLAHKRVSVLARKLHISPHTVRNHLRAIFSKLEVHSQAELLEKVLEP